MSGNQNVGTPRVLPRPDFDVGSPVDFTYKLPFTFTGTIEKVHIKLGKTDVGKLVAAGAGFGIQSAKV